jgi:hypothetical protein
LVGVDGEVDLGATGAPRLESHLAARLLEPLSRHVLPSRSRHSELSVGAIEAAH